MLAGIVLGEDEGLTEELRDDFKASGLYHLLAVSGQNITYLALGVLGLAWLLGISRLPAEVLAIAAIAGYVLAVGWQPSVVRAGVAGGLASLAWLLSRPRDRWHFLALGAAVLLAWTPASLLEPGFQLSFAAVASIFVLVPRLRLALEGYPLPGWLRDALAVSTACGAATAPILWLQFGEVPVYSLLANVLVTLVVGPLLGLALVGAAPRAGPARGGARARVVERLAGGLHRRLRRPRRRPAVRRRSAPAAAVAVLLGTPLALLGAATPAALAATDGARVRRRRSCPRSSLWQLLPTSGLPPPTGLRLTFLDVGQGDAILVQVPEGAVLVDQGPPEAEVAQQLRDLGVRRLAAARAHPPAARPRRRRGGGAPSGRRRARARSPPCIRRASTRARRWPRPSGAASSSSRSEPARRSGSASSGCACSGRTGRARRARIRTGCRSSCSPLTARPTRC